MKIRFYITMLFFFTATMVRSQPFTTGNIVVVRVGNSSAPLTTATAPVFLEEYTPTGIFVQAIPMPTSLSGINKRFTFQGKVVSLGALALSQNAQYLTLAGFDASPLTLNGTANGAATQRVIGLVDYNGLVNTSTGLTDAGTNATYSAVTSDGTNIWASFTSGGLRYTTLGSSTSTQIQSATTHRVVNIYGGDLYSGSSSGAVLKVGNGLSTTGPQTLITIISGGQGLSQNGYFLADLDPAISGYDVIYLAGEVGTLQKYSFDGSSWVSKGKIGTAADAYNNVTGVVNGTTVTLYAIRKVIDQFNTGQPSELVTLVDNTGQSGSITGMVPTLLTTSLTNTGFRGVAMAPVKCKQPLLRLGATTPTSTQVFVADSLDAGGPFEYEISTNAMPSVSGISTGLNSISSTTLNPGVHYYVHVRRNCGGVDFSQWATVDFTTAWPPCTVPLNIVRGLSNNNVTFSWNQVFTAIKYEYAVTTSSIPVASGQFVPGQTVSIQGLLSAKPYYFHVRTYCGGGDTSAWSTKLFTTPCFTPSPYLITNNWQAGTAELGWSGESGDQAFEYAILSSEAPVGGSIRLVYDTVISVKDLVPGNKYYFSVRQRCKGGTVSDWGHLEFNVSGAQVFPSPSNDKITIRVYGQETNGKPVYIYDANGRQVMVLSLSGNTATTNIQKWAPGVYFIRFGNEHKYLTRIIKL